MSTNNMEMDTMIYDYLNCIDYVKNNIVGKQKQWSYLKNRIICNNIQLQSVEQFFDHYDVIPQLYLGYIIKYIKCDQHVDFYFKQYKKNKCFFSIKILNDNFQSVWYKCKIICPNCGKEYSFKNQPKLYRQRNHIFCCNCICHFAQTIGGGQKNFQKTMIEKYGVKRPIQNKQIKNKTQKTMLQKYNAKSPFESQIVLKKIYNKMIDKYGADNPFKCQIFQKKCKQTLKNKYGSENIWKTQYCRNIIKNAKQFVSKISYLFFSSVQEKIKYKCLYGQNEKRFIIKNHCYFVDFFIQQLNVIVQFQGDFFHANPQIYNQNDVIFSKTAKQIWQSDNIKKQFIENYTNCVILYVWQNNVRKNFDNEVNNIVRKINQYVVK